MLWKQQRSNFSLPLSQPTDDANTQKYEKSRGEKEENEGENAFCTAGQQKCGRQEEEEGKHHFIKKQRRGRRGMR